uniref:Uncharacterized protein n=1 Tax=Oryzias sinensis TaxID=183150 RepID=A0A8C7YQ23_9TELE
MEKPKQGRKHLPSSQRKSGRATSCRGISFRKAGRWQRGLPVTIFLLLSQSPSQASRQSQLKEFAKSLLGRFLQSREGLQSVEGSRSDGGQLVVVQRQQTDVVDILSLSHVDLSGYCKFLGC